MRDIRTMNMTAGQKIENDEVMKRLGDLEYRNNGILSKMSLFDSGKALIIGNGLRVEQSSGMTVNVPAGTIFQRISSDDVIPCIQISDQTVTMTAASGIARIDIIEAQIKNVTDKDDVAQVGAIVGSSVDITLDPIKRDIKYYLSVRKQTDTTTSTAATAGTLTGTVAIPGTIDLSEVYLINLADGEDGSFQEIDCRGATPAATTQAEIISAINAAVGRVMAAASGDYIELTGNGTGQTSYFVIKPPTSIGDKDALEAIFGLSIGGAYKYIYQGENEWFKLAEIDIDVATTVITDVLIRNVDEKSTWASETNDILLGNNIYDYIDGNNIIASQIESTIATGTAPLVIASTTKVSNLNVEQVDGADLDTTTTLGTSDVKIPSQNAVKTYVDARLPVGSITMYGGAAAPTGWILCDGASLERTGTYANLFAAISTTFGAVDGSHFNVPDFRGIFPKGAGTTDRAAGKDANGNYYAGTLGTYLTDKMQGHKHEMNIHIDQSVRGASAGGVTYDGVSDDTGVPIADGTNGTPRTGLTTEPQSLGITFIIKY